MTTHLNYRFAQPGGIPELAALVAHSFPGAQRTPQWWAEQLMTPRYGGGADTIFIAEQRGRPVAMLQAHPLRQYVGGRVLPITGIGTVAISPAHRRLGIAADLMTRALRAGRERGDVASALYPFRTSFYQRLGYGQAGYALQHQIPPDSLPDSDERARVEVVDTTDGRAAMLELYNRWAATQTGQLVRGERVWNSIVSVADRALFACREGTDADRPDGYALVTYRADLPARDRYLEVEEIVWTTPTARRALYGWLSSLGDQWQQILIRSLPSHRFSDWVDEPRLPTDSAPNWSLWTPSATLMAGPMFRLLDVAAAWQQRTVVATTPALLRVELSDAQIEENSGAWTLVVESGHLSFERTPGNVRGSVPVLRTDISTLSRIYIGAMTTLAAVDAGRAECDRPELLAPIDAALELPEPWTFDRF